MSFGASFDDDEIMSEINMTPLVDVMLVLLIIFMITVPVIQHSVKIDLPRATNRVNDTRPPHINISLLENGTLHWNGKIMPYEQLAPKFAELSQQQPQPELHLYVARQTAYERVAKVMAAAQSNGITKIGFMTEPEKSP